MTEATCLQIVEYHLEGVAQAWWQSQSHSPKIYIELNEAQSGSSTSGQITTWDAFCLALQQRFYPPGYLYNLSSL